MELQTLDFSALHFPRKEWQWLRKPVRYPTNPKDAPDAFLWAAKVQDKIWAWHPAGTDLETAFPGMKTRVLLLETDGSELAAHGLYLKTAFSAVASQDVEWVAAIHTLTERLSYVPTDKGLPPYWKEALEAAGLSPHLGALAQRGRYAFLTSEERQLLFDKRWELATFDLLETLNPGVRKTFVQALGKWNVTAQQAKEAANHVMILAKKMGDKSAEKILAGAFKSPEEFRSALMHTSQPELAALSAARIEKLRALKVPPRTSVYGDPSFENDVLKITHTPRSITDFELFKSWVEDPEVLEKFKALFEIYQ